MRAPRNNNIDRHGFGQDNHNKRKQVINRLVYLGYLLPTSRVLRLVIPEIFEIRYRYPLEELISFLIILERLKYILLRFERIPQSYNIKYYSRGYYYTCLHTITHSYCSWETKVNLINQMYTNLRNDYDKHFKGNY